MKRRLCILGGAIVFLAGCACGQHSFLMSPIATLPSGDKLMDCYEYHGNDCPQNRRYILWQQPGKHDHELLFIGDPIALRSDQLKTAQLSTSPDGQRAWLSHDGKTFASFNRATGLAVLGDADQPAWATGPTPPP